MNYDHKRFYNIGPSSHLNTEVKQHWAWITLGWEALQGILEACIITHYDRKWRLYHRQYVRRPLIDDARVINYDRNMFMI